MAQGLCKHAMKIAAIGNVRLKKQKGALRLTSYDAEQLLWTLAIMQQQHHLKNNLGTKRNADTLCAQFVICNKRSGWKQKTMGNETLYAPLQ